MLILAGEILDLRPANIQRVGEGEDGFVGQIPEVEDQFGLPRRRAGL